MTDLEKRKLLAEFAGWTGLRVDERGHLLGACSDGTEECVPHYYSDPAAACSLLPKLLPLFLEAAKRQEIDQAPFSEFWTYLYDSLTDMPTPEQPEKSPCVLIFEAVRKIQEAR